MTTTPHGQVPEALRLAHIFDNPLPPEWPDMVAVAAELRRQHTRIAELEAVGAGGVQALSAAPEGWRELAAKVMDALADAQDTTNSQYPEYVRCYPSWERHARWLRWLAYMFRSGNPVGNGAGNPAVLAALAASPTPPAEQPDLTKLTERGAKAWAGVDAQALRDGTYQQGATKAAPAGFVPVAAFDRLHAHAESLAARLLAASPTPQALSAAPAEADMFWDAEDGERFGHDIDDIISDFGPGDRVKIDCAKRMPSIEVLVVADGDDLSYQAVSPTPPAKQQAITPETGNATSAQGAAITSESCAVYAELPSSVGDCKYGGGLYTDAQMRDFADRTHALRTQAAPKNDGFYEAINEMDGLYKTAPKAAPGELAESAAKGAIMGAAYDFRDAHISGSMNLKRSAHAILEAAVDSALAAPQQEAQEPYAYAVYFPDQPKVELVHELDDLIDDLTNRPHVVTKLYTAPQPSPAAQGDAIEHELAMLIRRIVSSARRNCEDGSNVLKLANEAWAYLVRKGLNGSPLRDAGIESDPTPPAKAADSVQEDAARYRWLRDTSNADDPSHMIALHIREEQNDASLSGIDAAIDAAIAAQGGKA